MAKKFGPKNIANLDPKFADARGLNMTSPLWLHMWAPSMHCPNESYPPWPLLSKSVSREAEVDNSNENGICGSSEKAGRGEIKYTKI